MVNKGQPVPSYLQLQPGATQKDAARADSFLNKMDSVLMSNAQRQFSNSMMLQNQQDREAKKNQPSADEIRRSDLANNMNENLDKLQDIVQRRPDLFGPVAGRLTSLRQWTGTDDPDIAALKTIHEYLGMASVGAHAMRNAQHVAEAADAVFNSYKNDPKAIMGSIQDARDSIKTFIGDVQGNAIRSQGQRVPAAQPKPQGPAQKPNPTGADFFSRFGGVAH
jgi:hypothetical protein